VAAFDARTGVWFSATSWIFDEAGNLLRINDWPPDIAVCVASIEVVMKLDRIGDEKGDIRWWRNRPRAQTEARERDP